MKPTFCPKLFIGIGENSHFYTLRETYLHEVHIRGQAPHYEVRSMHHFNLSQDAAEAVEKAKAFGELYGLPMTTTVEDLADDMRDIQRADATALERRAAMQRQREAEWDAERKDRLAEQIRKIREEGKITFGAHHGKHITELETGYIAWVHNNLEKFEVGSVMHALATEIAANFTHLLPPVPALRGHWGTIAKRAEVQVQVCRISGFTRTAFNGWSTEWVSVINMVASTGELLVCFTTSGIDLSTLDKVVIKCTPKSHEDYKGQDQTVVQRIAIVSRYNPETDTYEKEPK